MVTLTIDNRAIEVSDGTTVIDAAERLGIIIPRFCYLKALGAVGACRVCAVKFLEGPVKGIQMSCMTNAMDGMVVSTTDPDAVDFRRQVIEWLMVNHPHDCPVCDEGGHCLLQDTTVAGGHGRRRYTGQKRTYIDQDLGPLVQHEMNRCIHCYRCVRFYREYAGGSDLGVMGIASKVYFGRFEPGRLESPFAGNLIDLCPTGVYTNKQARFRARRWDLERAPSVCLHCSLGCNVMPGARYREVLRVDARENEKVNGPFICDRGRFGYPYANRADRPRGARVDGKPANWEEACHQTTSRLQGISAKHGSEAIAVLGSARSSLETQLAVRRLCKNNLWRPAHFFVDPETEKRVQQAAHALDRQLAATLRDIEGADCLIVVGADPLNEAPLLALAMRQASRKGAKIAVLDPRPLELPFAFDHLPVAVSALDISLAQLTQLAVGAAKEQKLSPAGLDYFIALTDRMDDREAAGELKKWAAALAASQKPAIICGTGLGPANLPALAADCARLLGEFRGDSRIFYTFAGANAFTAGLLTSPHPFAATLEAVEAGKVRALVVVESDPLLHCADRPRLARALAGLELLVVLDYLPSATADRADILLPTTTVFESGGSFVNQHGRLQYAEAVHHGGIPILQAGEGSHPPRLFSNGIPGGSAKSAPAALQELTGQPHPPVQTLKATWRSLIDDHPLAEVLWPLSYPADGETVLPEKSGQPVFASLAGLEKRQESKKELTVLRVDATFGSEELSSYAPVTEQLAPDPCLYLHPGDTAGRLQDGDQLRFPAGGADTVATVRLTERIAPGHLVIPRHLRLAGIDTAWPEQIGLEQLIMAKNKKEG